MFVRSLAAKVLLAVLCFSASSFAQNRTYMSIPFNVNGDAVVAWSSGTYQAGQWVRRNSQFCFSLEFNNTGDPATDTADWACSGAGGGGATTPATTAPLCGAGSANATQACSTTGSGNLVLATQPTIDRPNLTQLTLTGSVPTVGASCTAPDQTLLAEDTTHTYWCNGSVVVAIGGGSTTDVWISQIPGIHQGADLATGYSYGTTTPAGDDGPIISSYLAAHTALGHMLILHQDGASVVSGIFGPVGGWGIVSDAKPSMRYTPISGCAISSNVLTCTTTVAHGLSAGQGVLLNGFPSSTFLNYSLSGGPAIVIASVPSTTTFTAAYTHANASIEAGVAQVISGNGFYAKTGTNNDVINNCTQPGTCTGSSMNPGWTSPGPAPTRSGGGLIFRNLFINGNRGNGTTGNSTNGNPNGISGFTNVYTGSYRTYADLNIWNASGVEITGNWLFNAPSYMANLSNVSNVFANDNVFDTTGPGVLPSEENGDGLHVNGPAENLHANGNLFRTGDDAWALNAPEGYVGPINNVTITNSTYDHALSAGRIYTDSIAPPTGDVAPTVSNVLVDGGVGTVQYDVMEFGFEGTHTLSVGNTMWNMRTANLNLTVTGGAGNQAGFRLSDSVVDLTFDHIAISGVAQGNLPLFNTFNNSGFASLSFNDITINRTALGSTTGGLLGGTAAAYGRLSLNGVRIVDTDTANQATTNYGATPALITTATGTTIATLFHSGVDMTNVTALLSNPSAATSIQTDGGSGGGAGAVSGANAAFVATNTSPATGFSEQTYFGTYAGQAVTSFNRVPATGSHPNPAEDGVYSTVGVSGGVPFFDVSYDSGTGGTPSSLLHILPTGVTGPGGEAIGSNCPVSGMPSLTIGSGAGGGGVGFQTGYSANNCLLTVSLSVGSSPVAGELFDAVFSSTFPTIPICFGQFSGNGTGVGSPIYATANTNHATIVATSPLAANTTYFLNLECRVN